ncbi:uncharacterized protein ARMOST_17269 [Armillaria ostoyae]|uniref:Uncharacterized protein n=1 Tax=Armillaria ostoyae TaxID=47428 RepID=A0A284RYH5_ARMOS|nr:uncharacterized protein ARMOST_17269 [Armillaria ostoyae]
MSCTKTRVRLRDLYRLRLSKDRNIASSENGCAKPLKPNKKCSSVMTAAAWHNVNESAAQHDPVAPSSILEDIVASKGSTTTSDDADSFHQSLAH